MNTDLDALFAAAKTDFGDGGDFISSLDQKLEKVEYVKSLHRQKQRYFRKCLCISFALGVFFGCLGIAVLSILPSDGQLIATLGRYLGGEVSSYVLLLAVAPLCALTLVASKLVMDLFEIKFRSVRPALKTQHRQ